MLIRYVRPSKRNPSQYVLASRKQDALAQANAEDLSKRKSICFEPPVKPAEKTVHDIVREYRSKGLHLLGDL